MTQKQLLDEYASLPHEAQRQVDEFVAFLRQKYQSAHQPQQRHIQNLDDEPFLGMWQNRQEMEDSSAWVNSIRKSEWG
jgi:hypothetical protein